MIVELNGEEKEKLRTQKGKENTIVTTAMPRFGIRTIRLKSFRAF